MRRDAIQVDEVLSQLPGPDDIDADDIEIAAFRLKSRQIEGDEVGDVGGAIIAFDGDIGADFVEVGDDAVFGFGVIADRVAEEFDGDFFIGATIKFMTIRQCQTSREGEGENQDQKQEFSHDFVL